MPAEAEGDAAYTTCAVSAPPAYTQRSGDLQIAGVYFRFVWCV